MTDQGHRVHDLAAEEVSRGMAEGRYLLVDVREPNEVVVDAYPGAVVVPLSSFDPQAIPDPKGKEVVFACRSGKRSVTALLAGSVTQRSVPSKAKPCRPGPCPLPCPLELTASC